MHVKAFVVSPLQSNCYLLAESLESQAAAVIIDPGDDSLEEVFAYVGHHQLQVEAVWCTHGHFDHVLGVDRIRQEYGVPAYLHRADLPLFKEAHQHAYRWLGKQAEPLLDPDVYWTDGDVVSVGNDSFTVWHTPGHSPGSVCLVEEKIAFTGDTLFAGTIGRTDFPESSPADMESSLKRLLALPDSVTLYPGHMAQTKMLRERQNNPFLNHL